MGTCAAACSGAPCSAQGFKPRRPPQTSEAQHQPPPNAQTPHCTPQHQPQCCQLQCPVLFTQRSHFTQLPGQKRRGESGALTSLPAPLRHLCSLTPPRAVDPEAAHVLAAQAQPAHRDALHSLLCLCINPDAQPCELLLLHLNLWCIPRVSLCSSAAAGRNFPFLWPCIPKPSLYP